MSSLYPSPREPAFADGFARQERHGEKLGRSLAWSGLFHFTLVALLVVSAFLSQRGASWGGGSEGGGAVQVSLVGSLPAIPLPSPDVMTTSRVADTTKGLYESLPPPPKPLVPPKAVEIPEFTKEKPRKWITPRKSKLLENKAVPPPNAVPYGKGGTPTIPYSASTFTMGQNSAGALTMGGAAGGFGNMYPWYVQAVQRRVSNNWLQSTIDQSVSWAPAAVIDFQIMRDGTIVNIQLMKSSGYASVDASAVRAIQMSSPLSALPGAYTGSFVNVEFSFNYKK